MKVVFDQPQPIEKLRVHYNEKVTYVTTVKNYPLVESIEFPGDYHAALRKRSVPVKIGKKVDKLIEKYKTTLVEIWNDHRPDFTTTEKADTLTLPRVLAETDPDLRAELMVKYLRQQKESLRKKLKAAAVGVFAAGYTLGKNRGQVLTHQDLNDDLNLADEKILSDKLAWNDEYIDGLTDDLDANYQETLEAEYETEEALKVAFAKVHESDAYRLPLFAAALGSVIVPAGTSQAIREVQGVDENGEPTGEAATDPDTGEPIGDTYQGGIWHTHHDPVVCDGCEANDGLWMTLDQYMDESGTNDCLTNCRCPELFEPADRPTDDTQIWIGTPGIDKSAKVSTLVKHLPGQHDQLTHAGIRTAQGETDKQSIANSKKEVAKTAERIMQEQGLDAKFSEMRDQIKNGVQTRDQYKIGGEYTSERKQLHNQIIDKVLTGTTPSTEPTFILMGGLPGSGKSSIVKEMALDNYVRIDSDAIKMALPEYAGWNAALLQLEADDVIGKLMVRAASERRNVLLDGTMKTYEKANRLTDVMANLGYKIGVVFSDVAPEEAIQRAITRYQKAGRFVDPLAIAAHDHQNIASYHRLKNEVDFARLYDNNERGAAPKLKEDYHVALR